MIEQISLMYPCALKYECTNICTFTVATIVLCHNAACFSELQICEELHAGTSTVNWQFKRNIILRFSILFTCTFSTQTKKYKYNCICSYKTLT